jgi:hypothetical protein
MISMIDASEPLTTRPASSVVAGYIGGNTPHVWTKAQWNSFTGRKRLPIYVADAAQKGAAAGEIDAWDALHALLSNNVPISTRVVYDMEAVVDAPKVQAFANILNHFGYEVWVYGSKDFVFGNPKCNGYWVADFTGKSHMAAGKNVRATQYAPNVDGYDLSVVKTWVFRFTGTKWWS